jgi:hypothetical protein
LDCFWRRGGRRQVEGRLDELRERTYTRWWDWVNKGGDRWRELDKGGRGMDRGKVGARVPVWPVIRGIDGPWSAQILHACESGLLNCTCKRGGTKNMRLHPLKAPFQIPSSIMSIREGMCRVRCYTDCT